jgi:hypothetical protein
VERGKLTRRGAIAGLVGVTAGVLLKDRLSSDGDAAGISRKAVFGHDFAGDADQAGWPGARWHAPIHADKLRVRDGHAELPAKVGVPSSATEQPLPVFCGDRDTTGAAHVAAVFTVATRGSSVGVLAGASDQYSYVAAVIDHDGTALSLIRWDHRHADRLATKPVTPIRRGQSYRLELALANGRVSARLTPANSSPSGWQVSAPYRTPAGPAGHGVVMVGGTAHDSLMRLSSYEVLHSDAPLKPSAPRTLYLMAGAPAANGAVRLRCGTERAATVTFQWADDAGFTRNAGAGSPQTSGPPYFTAQDELVPPAGGAYWRVHLKDPSTGLETVSPAQRIVAYDPAGPLVLGATSCAQLWDEAPYLGLRRFWREAAPAEPVAMVYQGDFGYPSNNHDSAHRFEPDYYQDRISRFLADRHFVELRSRMQVPFTMDDHEYGPVNNANRLTLYPWTISLWNHMQADPSEDGYFDWKVGDVHCLTLDHRRYADPAKWPQTPEKTRLGLGQKAWAKSVMRGSDARLFVVYSGSIFASRTAIDSMWDSWRHEFNEMISFFHGVQLGGRRVVILTGDAHGFRMHYHPDPEQRKGAHPVVEFVCAGLRAVTWSMNEPGDPTVDPRRRVTGRSGLGMMVVDPASAANRTVTLRAINGDAGRLDLFPKLVLPFQPAPI